MHKSASNKNQELSIVLDVDKYLPTKTEKFNFYNKCKKLIRQKFESVNLGMLIFFKNFSKKEKKNCQSSFSSFNALQKMLHSDKKKIVYFI